MRRHRGDRLRLRRAAARLVRAPPGPDHALPPEHARPGPARLDARPEPAAGHDGRRLRRDGADDLPLGPHLPDREHAPGDPARDLRHPPALLRRDHPRRLPARLRDRRALARGARAPRHGRRHPDRGLAALQEEAGLTAPTSPPR